MHIKIPRLITTAFMHSTPILLVLSCGVSSGSLLLSITTFFSVILPNLSCSDSVTYIRVTRNSNTIPILNSNNTVVYLTQVNEGNSISFIYTVGFYRCFGIHNVISLCLPKLLTPLYTPKLYNNDNYKSLDISVYEY